MVEQYFGWGGGSSGETKIGEGIRDAKNCHFVLYIAFAGKVGVYSPPGSATHAVMLTMQFYQPFP